MQSRLEHPLAYLLRLNFQCALVCRIAAARSARKRLRQPGRDERIRIGGKGAAVAVLILTSLKACCLGRVYALRVTPFQFIAIAAQFKSIVPAGPFGFKGGKGEVTAFGAIAPIG